VLLPPQEEDSENKRKREKISHHSHAVMAQVSYFSLLRSAQSVPPKASNRATAVRVSSYWSE
jgi:hypothetical protein